MKVYYIKPYHEVRIYDVGDLEGPCIKIYSHSSKMKGSELTQYKAKSGYMFIARKQLNAKTGKTSSNTFIHRMVASLVYGPCPPKMYVAHIDGNKQNNHPSNLKYTSYQWQTSKPESQMISEHDWSDLF